jgi:hypothetical protein
MHRLWAVPLGIALSIGPLCSQPTSLSGPIQGYSFDLPTQSFRAVIGLPGSASFGPALATGFDMGWVAPHQSYAIGCRPRNRRRRELMVGRGPAGDATINTCFLVTGFDSSPVSTSVTGLSGQPDGMVWSGDGSVAVLYSRSGAWLQVLSGLPGAPRVGSLVDLSPLGGSLSAVATDQQGKSIALAIQGDLAIQGNLSIQSNGGGVFLSTDGQTFVSALPMANPVALAFSGDGASLYILDGGALQLDILAINGYSSQNFALDGLENPSAIASGRDAQGRPIVYVAGASDQILQAYDLATQQVLVNLPLYFLPTGIAAFGPNSFVICSPSKPGDALWLFTSVPQPAVYFVPATKSGEGGLN